MSPPPWLRWPASCGGADACAVAGRAGLGRRGSVSVVPPRHQEVRRCCFLLPGTGGPQAEPHLSCVPGWGSCLSRPAAVRGPFPADTPAACCWGLVGEAVSVLQSCCCLYSQSLWAQSSRCCCRFDFSPSGGGSNTRPATERQGKH